MAIEVKSFKDKEGNKVVIGDLVGYMQGAKAIHSGQVVRIVKSGYYVEVFLEGYKRSFPKMHIEKLF